MEWLAPGQRQSFQNRSALPQPSTRTLRGLPSAYASPLRSSARFALGSVSAQELQQTTKAGLRAVGIRRAVPASALGSAETSVSASGGRIWRLTLTSPDAIGIRVHFLNFAAGQTAANAAVTPVGPDGSIVLCNGSNTPVDLIVDLNRTFAASS